LYDLSKVEATGEEEDGDGLEEQKRDRRLRVHRKDREGQNQGKNDDDNGPCWLTHSGHLQVEHIVREDYLVEAYEILEMFCDLLLARFGLIQQMKTLDEGLAEAISSIIWVAPRLQADVQELKVVSDQLASKYGKPYAQACRENSVGTVSEKLMHKMSVQAPPKVTVEKYMMEITKYYNVEYEPDPQVMAAEGEAFAADALVDLGPAPPAPEKSDLNGGSQHGGGGGGAAAPPPASQQPFNYPQAGAGGAAAGYQPGGFSAPAGYNIPPADEKSGLFEEAPPAYFPPDMAHHQPPMAPGAHQPAIGQHQHPLTAPGFNQQQQHQQPPMAPGAAAPFNRTHSLEDNAAKQNSDVPELPGVPDDTPVAGLDDSDDEDRKGGGDEEIDFDDLTKRFEALKKKK